MRTLIGFLAFNGVALALGLSILLAAGLVGRRWTSMLAAAGAALLAGLAAIGLGAVVAVVAGLGLNGLVVAVCALAAAAALAAFGWRRAATEDDQGWPGGPIGWLPPALIVVVIAVQILASREVPVAWDAAHIWTLKAFALTSNGHLEGRIFSGSGAFTTSHPSYPIFLPVLGAVLCRFAATAQQGLLVGQLWVILGATVLAVPWLVRAGRLTWLALAPMALAMASAPASGLLRGDADVTMACLTAAGAVALVRWLESGQRGYAVLGALWLAAAANTKNEGTAFAIAVLVAVFVASLLVRPRRPIPVVLVGVAVAAMALPWRLWALAHGPFTSDIAPLSDSLSVGYLLDRLDHLDLGAQTLLGELISPGAHWLAPAFLAVAGAAIVARRSRVVAGTLLAVVVLAVLDVIWVYWTSQQPDVPAHILRTSIRTVTGPLFLAAAGLAYLLPRLADPLPEAEPPAAPAVREEPPAPVSA